MTVTTHRVEVFTERSTFGIPRWEALCSCGWSWEVLGLGVDGQGLAIDEGIDHVEPLGGSIWGVWADDDAPWGGGS